MSNTKSINQAVLQAALRKATGSLPGQRFEFEIIVTTDQQYLGGGPGDTNIYYAATNLPELSRDASAKRKIYLHPAWFDLPEPTQQEILEWCLKSLHSSGATLG